MASSKRRRTQSGEALASKNSRCVVAKAFLPTLNLSVFNCPLAHPIAFACPKALGLSKRVKECFQALVDFPMDLCIIEKREAAADVSALVGLGQLGILMELAVNAIRNSEYTIPEGMSQKLADIGFTSSNAFKNCPHTPIQLDKLDGAISTVCTFIRVDEPLLCEDEEWSQTFASALQTVAGVNTSREDRVLRACDDVHIESFERYLRSSRKSTGKKRRESPDLPSIFAIPQRKSRKSNSSVTRRSFNLNHDIEDFIEHSEAPIIDKNLEPGRPRKYLPGELFREACEIWDKNKSMQGLYSKKDFLKAGLYSGALNTESLSSTMATALAAEDNSGVTTHEVEVKKMFAFEMPIYHGESILETQDDFFLPFDLYKFTKVVGAGDMAPKPQLYDIGKRKPAPFIRIKKNLFIDRKPNKAPIDAPVCFCMPPIDGSPGCGKDCLNRLMQFECTPGKCPLGALCSNQAFQKGVDFKGLELCLTNGRGFGIRTTTHVAKDTLLMEYCGEIISEETCLERMNTIYAHTTHYYFLNYGRGEVIDGCQKGSLARFVNHSCDPNCRIEKWNANGEFHVGIFADHNIEPGMEITYDYKFETFSGSMKKCLCGGRKCRGFLGLNSKSDSLSEIRALKLASSKATLDRSELEADPDDPKESPFAFRRVPVRRNDNRVHLAYTIHVLRGNPFSGGVSMKVFGGWTPQDTILGLYRDAVAEATSSKGIKIARPFLTRNLKLEWKGGVCVDFTELRPPVFLKRCLNPKAYKNLRTNDVFNTLVANAKLALRKKQQLAHRRQRSLDQLVNDLDQSMSDERLKKPNSKASTSRKTLSKLGTKFGRNSRDRQSAGRNEKENLI